MKNKKILFVDDDPVQLVIMEGIFKKNAKEYELLTSPSAEDALSLIPAFKPDLILLDIDMPGMNGYEFCRKIREDDALRFIKIVMVSSHADINERLAGYKAGANDYIAKPFDTNELLAKIQVFLQLKDKEEMDQIKYDLLVLITHETSTPITSILGCTELIMRNTKATSQIKDLAEMAHTSGKRLYDFIKKAILLCEIRSGRTCSLQSQPVSACIESTLYLLNDALSKKNLTVSKTFNFDNTLHADWPLILRVIEYVLDNAIKFSPEGGQIDITAEQIGEDCVIKISDHGEGIAPTFMEKIFDEFAVKDINYHKMGQGLSLALAKHIMDMHEGSITAQSREGEGATFTITLPGNLGTEEESD